MPTERRDREGARRLGETSGLGFGKPPRSLCRQDCNRRRSCLESPCHERWQDEVFEMFRCDETGTVSSAIGPTRGQVTAAELKADIRQLALLPSFYLLGHRLEVSLHARLRPEAMT